MLNHARFDELSVSNIVLTEPAVNGACSCCSMGLYLSLNIVRDGPRTDPARLLSCSAVSVLKLPCLVAVHIARPI
jgi:hypothetical protein